MTAPGEVAGERDMQPVRTDMVYGAGVQQQDGLSVSHVVRGPLGCAEDSKQGGGTAKTDGALLDLHGELGAGDGIGCHRWRQGDAQSDTASAPGGLSCLSAADRRRCCLRLTVAARA